MFGVAALLCALPLAGLAIRASRAPQASTLKPHALFRINPNSAPSAQLRLLPGAGPALADRIAVERHARPFTDGDDLRRVDGIGAQLPRRWQPFITFEPR